MRFIILIGILVGLLITLSSCFFPLARAGSSAHRPKSVPLGVQIGEESFNRKELGQVGSSGIGLIRVDWNGDGKDDVLILRSDTFRGSTSAALIDNQLKTEELFSLSDAFLRAPTAADMDGDGLPELCSGATWGTSAVVFSHTGDQLFTYAAYKGGADEAILADLKNDNHALLIIGFNGGGGLRAADATGKEIFHDNRDLGNVWNVEAADLDGDGKLEVINSDAGGELTVWSSSLKYLRTLNPPDYTAGFAAVDHDGDGKSELLLESGRMIDGEGDEVYPGNKSKGMPFPSYAVTADISSSPGLETAWAQDSYNDFKIFAQKGDILYQEGLKGKVTGLISTTGLEGWEPGFLLQLEDGTLLHYVKSGKIKAGGKS